MDGAAFAALAPRATAAWAWSHAVALQSSVDSPPDGVTDPSADTPSVTTCRPYPTRDLQRIEKKFTEPDDFALSEVSVRD